MSFDTPVTFYDRFNALTTKWFRLLFVPGVDLQAAEMNEVQSMIQNQIAKLGGGIFKNGTFLVGGEKAVQRIEDETVVTINAGSLWADAVHDVPAGSVPITGIGTEVIYLKITYTVLTEEDDPSLLDPAEEAENYGFPGAKRLLLNYEYVLNINTGIPIVTLIDGQIVQDSSHNGFLDLLYKILAQRTYEQFGQFIAERPQLKFEETTNLDSNPAQMVLLVDNGVAYNRGYRLENPNRSIVTILRPLTGQQTIEEPHTFLTGNLVYELADGPVTSIDQLSAVIQSPNISMSRGLTLNGSDDIPVDYRPVQGVVSCTGPGPVTYVQGVNFTRSNYTITWIAGQPQPAPGTTYTLVVNYTKDLTKGVRTITTATNEDHTVAASGNTLLTHADVSKLISLVNTTTSATLIEGTDFTLNYGTGSITWINRPTTGNVVRANYTWWTHTTEGDYVARDSFRDSGGSKLFNSTPIKTPTGADVDYTTDISFDVVGGKVPVSGMDFDVDYTYSLGRVDVLAWRKDGIIQAIPGEPGLTPSPPVVNDSIYVPIAKLVMPPEAIGEEVQIEWYNNLIMKVVEQRQLHQQVQTLAYNSGLNQLLQSAQNIQTDTPKKGIFTDDFSNPLNMDLGHTLFAGTCDFIGKRFILPRTVGKVSPTVSSAVGATLLSDTWVLDHTTQIALTQSVKSRTETINSFGAVNEKAKVTITPALSIVNSETLNITMNAQWDRTVKAKERGAYDQIAVTNALLLGEVSPGSGAAASYGTSQTLADDLLNKIGVEDGWTKESSSSALTTNNKWAKVLTELDIITGGTQVPHTLTISGSGFRANDRAIQCFFDGEPINITPTGATVAETDPNFTGCVKANAQGVWTGTITTPSNVPSGTHNLMFMAHDTSDLGRITSIANTSFITGGTSTQVNITITLSKHVASFPCKKRAAMTLCAVLGYKGDKNVTGSVDGPLAYTIAYAIDGAIKSGLSFTEETLIAGIAALLTQMYRYSVTNLGIIATNLAQACTIAANNVQSNASAMLAAEPFYASKASGPSSLCYVDPLAQTFSFSQTKYVKFVNLYFSQLPIDDAVGVAIAPVENGIPTEKYIAITYKQASEITSTTAATQFVFDKLLILDPNMDYAIVVLTNDPQAALWTAAVGDQESGTGNLILVNPSSGVLLKSTDAASWTPIQGHSMKFDIGCAVFSDTPAYLNFGTVTFAQLSSIIAFYMPFSEITQDTKIIYQYSVDGGATWLDFSPLKEQELNGAFAEVDLRIKLIGTPDFSPTVLNLAVMQYMIYQTTGNYVSETWATGTATARYAEIFATTVIPGNTTLPFYVSYDSGSTWNLMTEDTGAAIDIDGTQFQRHYTHDSGAADKQNIKFRVGLNTTVTAVTPSVTDIIGLAR